ncbi:MAG: DegV family protein, partial [Candidatus Heimdallarchaeaceae archaeon]
MNVHVLVDSCSDLSNTVRERMDISMIPLNIKLDRQLLDQLDITPQEYFARIDDFGLPETSSPNFAQWKEAYDNIFSRGFQKIVVITISSQLSNTYQQAVISSKKFYPGKIMVLDSHRASAGEGLIAIKFKQLLDKNYAVEEVNTFVEKNIPKVVE